MKIYSVGIIDYDMGNHASVIHTLRDIGFRVKLSNNRTDLDRMDILILPGVGAFPAAMKSLHSLDLINYIHQYANLGRPLIGICLGMQLLANSSSEYKYTEGLGLISGEIVPFLSNKCHIGWNTVKFFKRNSLWTDIDDNDFYFNHSFFYQGPSEYQMALTHNFLSFPSIIQRENIVGLQFHPEKSQLAGKTLLKNLIMGLINA